MLVPDRYWGGGLKYNLAQTAQLPWLPGYRIKAGPDRIAGAAIMQACIDRERLHHLRLPIQNHPAYSTYAPVTLRTTPYHSRNY